MRVAACPDPRMRPWRAARRRPANRGRQVQLSSPAHLEGPQHSSAGVPGRAAGLNGLTTAAHEIDDTPTALSGLVDGTSYYLQCTLGTVLLAEADAAPPHPRGSTPYSSARSSMSDNAPRTTRTTTTTTATQIAAAGSAATRKYDMTPKSIDECRS